MERLEARETEALKLIGEHKYRIWRIYMAGSAYAFERNWIAWAGQFGPLLLAYIGGVGHPWTVYAAQPVPLRVDFAFHAESALDQMRAWPNAPQSVDAMVLYDATGGGLAAIAQTLVGQSLAPPDPAATFVSVCGDFWYYILRTLSRVQRGQGRGRAVLPAAQRTGATLPKTNATAARPRRQT